jgi:glycosyltransferase involved in cell wall biosynthesis
MESISYITCTHNHEILNNCLLRSIKLDWEDELIVVENPQSIAEGYNTGIDQAKHKIKCFIHHDLIVTNPILLRMNLMAYCTQDIGIVGVIGCKNGSVPWWEGDTLGSALDTRKGIIWFNEGKDYCESLDGILLATFQDVRFDESIPGFHLYDQDICKQMTSQGLRNFCAGDGYRMVTHFTSAPSDVNQINGYNEALDVYRKKWKC